MHRFVWDVHYTKPNSLSHNFPISAIPHDTPELPLGAFAMPGTYTVKLHVANRPEGAEGLTQTLALKMDPRIKTSLADLRKQFEMQSGAVEGMNESFEALAQVQSLRAQLKDRAAKAGKGALSDAIVAFDKKAAALEGGAEASFFGLPASGKQPENLSTLNQHFGGILGVADTADAAPTTQANVVYQELESALETLLSKWKAMEKQDLPALNALLKNANLSAVDPSVPPKEPPSADADGDDDP